MGFFHVKIHIFIYSYKSVLHKNVGISTNTCILSPFASNTQTHTGHYFQMHTNANIYGIHFNDMMVFQLRFTTILF